MNRYSLNNTIAVVTGASRGIGKQIAKDLLKSGSKVALISRNKEDLVKISNEFEYVDTIHFADQKSREIIAHKISEYIKPKIKECRED